MGRARALSGASQLNYMAIGLLVPGARPIAPPRNAPPTSNIVLKQPPLPPELYCEGSTGTVLQRPPPSPAPPAPEVMRPMKRHVVAWDFGRHRMFFHEETDHWRAGAT